MDVVTVSPVGAKGSLLRVCVERSKVYLLRQWLTREHSVQLFQGNF